MLNEECPGSKTSTRVQRLERPSVIVDLCLKLRAVGVSHPYRILIGARVARRQSNLVANLVHSARVWSTWQHNIEKDIMMSF